MTRAFSTTPRLTRRNLIAASFVGSVFAAMPGLAQAQVAALLGTKRAPTPADSQALAAYQASQTGVQFFDDFSSQASLQDNWTVYTDDRPDLLACRSADSLAPGPGGLTINTTAATHCHDKWSTGQIISRKGFLYGYFEAYMKIASGPGLDNAFWLTTTNGSNDGSGDDFEIDIVEAMYPNDDHITLHRHNLHKWHDVGELGFDHRASEPLSDNYNYYAALWTRDSITFGLNGTAVGVIGTGGVITGPANIHLSTALGKFGGAPPDDPAGLAMHVKHVRVLAVQA